MELISSTMFTFLISRLWLGQSQQQLAQHQVLVKVIAQFSLVPILSSMEVSGLMKRTWRRQVANIKDLPFKNAIWMILEFWIQKHLSGHVWELVVLHQNIDMAILWMCLDQTFYFSVDGQKHLVPDLSTNQQKKAVIISWYGQLTLCLGNVVSISVIHQLADSATQVQQSDLTCSSLVDGNILKLKTK